MSKATCLVCGLPVEHAYSHGDPHDCIDALIEVKDALLAACEAMSACCGSSENWNGETHEALMLIEAAIEKAKEGNDATHA